MGGQIIDYWRYNAYKASVSDLAFKHANLRMKYIFFFHGTKMIAPERNEK